MAEDAINEKLLDKLRSSCASYSEMLESLPPVAARLLSRMTSLDKSVKEKTLHLIRKKKDVLPIFLSVLEIMDDQSIAIVATRIIREIIGPKSGGVKCGCVRQLIDLNGTQFFIKMLLQLRAKDTYMGNQLLQQVILILGHLSHADAKFCGKVKTSNAANVFHYYLRLFYQSSYNKMVLPLLTVLKEISKNDSLMIALIENDVTSTMENILIGFSLTAVSKLKLLLAVLAYLTKNAYFCKQMIKAGVVAHLLKVFSRWERYEGRAKLKICSDIVTTLHHFTYSKAGRAAIRLENSFTLMYKFCLDCPKDKSYDKLVAKVCAIINVCVQKEELPLISTFSPLKFDKVKPVKSRCEDEPESDDSDAESRAQKYGGMPDVSRSESSHDADAEPPVTCVIDNHVDRLERLKSYRKFFTEYHVVLYDVTNRTDCSKSSNRQQLENGCDCSMQPNPNRNGSLDILDDLETTHVNQRSLYYAIASKVNYVMPVVKCAYPDVMGGDGLSLLQPFFSKDRKILRCKLVNFVDQSLRGERLMNNTVYDLDKLIQSNPTRANDASNRLCNNDETRLGLRESQGSSLRFESRFESGNLRKVIQVGQREYDLILSPDVNCSHHTQWFYFEVTNMDCVGQYVFNVINCEKSDSLFNYGMKPLLYSVKESTLGRPGWSRVGTQVCYYRNGYKVADSTKLTYSTITFTIKFPHSLDVCYVASSFPYTYATLLRRVVNWMRDVDSSGILFRVDNLCRSLNNNQVPLITVSAPDSKDNYLANRELVFLTARVHPGEPNSSWVMDGALQYLLGDTATARKLRKQYVFKIVPMLNVEGVVNGCQRCGLTGEDLNRRWYSPDPERHPTIYHTKSLLEYCAKALNKLPFVFCDFHGHTRSKNVFMFGCSNRESWLECDRRLPELGLDYLLLPHAMMNCAPAFDIDSCTYNVERSREATARVTVWREFGVKRSYTLETTFCGCDQGPYKGYHLDTNHLREIGSNFCMAVSTLYDETKLRNEMIVAKLEHDSERYFAKSERRSSSSSVESAEEFYHQRHHHHQKACSTATSYSDYSD